MSSYDVAMDLLRLDDVEFAEVFAWIKKADYELENIDKSYIELEKEDMTNATDTKKLTEILNEIIKDTECCSYAWWKVMAKEAFLKNTAEFQQRRLMEAAIVVNNIYNKMVADNKVDTNNFEGDIMEVLTDLAREFEYTFFETKEYEDDYVGLLEKWLPNKFKEAFE